MTKTVAFSAKLLASVLFTLVLLEIGLRLFPGLIPVELLVQFNYGFTPIVSCMPSAYLAYASHVSFEEPLLNELMPWYGAEQCRYLSQKASELGYVFVDLTPALQTAAQQNGPDNLLYYRYDLHLTPAGHTVVAQTLARVLAEANISPRLAP